MKPLILDFAIPRIGERTISYQYDFESAMNMLTVEGKKMPFIDSNVSDVSLETKTKVRSEADDDTFGLFEMATKTEVRNERDDKHPSLLELTTKTLTRQESDDK